MNDIKQDVIENDLSEEGEITDAVNKAAGSLNVTLTDDQIDKIVALMQKLFVCYSIPESRRRYHRFRRLPVKQCLLYHRRKYPLHRSKVAHKQKILLTVF